MEKRNAHLPVFLGNIHNLDVDMFRWMMKRKHLALWARLCRYLSRTADGFGYPLVGLWFWYREGTNGQLLVLTLALTFVFERPLYFLLKKGLKRNRPAAAIPNYSSFIVPSDRFSFPSGHTSGAFAMATALALFFPELAPLGYAWAFMVGVSRVTLGVHFPTDTLAGALMGSLLCLFAGFRVTQ